MSEEQKDKAEETKEEPPKKSKMPIFLGIGALVLGGGGFGAYKMMSGGAPPAEAGQAAAAPAPVEEKEVSIPLDTFVVNLADQENERFMKVTMQAVVSDPSLSEAFDVQPLLRARVRDRVLAVLSAHTFYDVSNPTGKEKLRSELVREVADVFKSDKVKEVLFIEFVVQ